MQTIAASFSSKGPSINQIETIYTIATVVAAGSHNRDVHVHPAVYVIHGPVLIPLILPCGWVSAYAKIHCAVTRISALTGLTEHRRQLVFLIFQSHRATFAMSAVLDVAQLENELHSTSRHASRFVGIRCRLALEVSESRHYHTAPKF
ncbi:hypothetical protein TNCV_1862571 [Trichonephila clavipes]|nr:hypothetical protein TNCV_1862571 [Trichonephila clavipes]